MTTITTASGAAGASGPDSPTEGRGHVMAVALALTKRNLVSIVRTPSAIIPSLIFPLFGTIAFASVYGAAIERYFPHLPRMNWYVPLNVLQGATFGAVFLSFGLIRDFMTGFFDRFAVAPLPRVALLLGTLLSAVVRALLPVVLVLIVGWLGGMSLPGGVLAIVALVGFTWAVALIGVCWGAGLAYRFKSMAAAPLMQVGVFVLVFLSESQVPKEGLTGWLSAVAKVNPATYLLRAGRQGFLGHVTWHETWPGLLAFIGLFTAALAWVWTGLRKAAP